MNRRSFFGGLGALAVAGAASGERTRFYSLESFKLKAGAELPRLHEFWSTFGNGPRLLLEALIAPYMPQMLVVYGVCSKLIGSIESGMTLLEAAPGSPEIAPFASTTSRIFELRTYHSPSGAEIEIFRRNGLHPLFYSSTNALSRIYLIPFESLAARERAWTAVSADPDWVRLREEQNSSVRHVSLWKRISYPRSSAFIRG